MKTITKNILDVDKGTIAHQVNCFGAMGGLAGAIANKWPFVRTDYLKFVKLFEKKRWVLLGKQQTVKVKDDLKVANIFGQYDFGTDSRKTEYGSLKIGLFYAAQQNVVKGYPLYVPYKIGCGLAGGDWDIVQGILRLIEEDIDEEIIICKL